MSDIPKDMSFAGIPVVINPYMPTDELWLIVSGQKISIFMHEGQREGETVEHWLNRPQIHRIINIGTMMDIQPVPPPSLILKKDK